MLNNKKALIVAGVAVVVLIIGCFTANSVVNLLEDGLIQPEMNARLPHFLDLKKSFPEKIFDVNIVEFGTYQSRELSYIFDIIDCKFISYFFNHGYPHFISIIHFVFIFMIVIAYYYFNRTVLGNSFFLTILLLVLFLSSPVMYFSGCLFRSAKIGASLTIYLILVLSYKLVVESKNAKSSINTFIYLLIFIFSLAASLFDKQGFFIVASISIITFSLYFIFKRRQNLIISFLLSLSVLLYLLWNRIISPFLTNKMVGYYPDLSFQNFKTMNSYFSYGESSIMKMLNYETLKQAILLFFDAFRFFMGNINLWLSFFLYLLLLMMLYRYMTDKMQKKGSKLLAVLLILISNVFVVVMLSAMYVRHPPIIWPQIKRGGLYGLPITVVILFIVSIIISKIKWKYSNNIIAVILLIFVSNNILELPNHDKIIKDASRRYSAPTKYILDSLKQRYDRKLNDYIFQSSDKDLISTIRRYPAVVYLFVVKEAKRKH